MFVGHIKVLCVLHAASGPDIALDQGWATLLALRATLETSKVSAGQYMYNKANN